MAEFGDPLLDDFRNFLYVGLRRLYSVDPTPMQYSIAEWVADESHPLRMVQAPRGQGKSTITQFYVIWDAWRDWVRSDGSPSVQWMTVCGTRDLAVQFTSYEKQLLESIPQLQCLVPENPVRWSSTALDLAGAVPAPSPNLYARGVFGRMTGDRALKIAFDDIEIPQNAETQGQRDKLRRRVAEFLDVLKPGGQIVGLGTPQVEDTLYNLLPSWGFEIRTWTAEFPDSRWMEHHGHKLAPWIKDQMDEDPSLVGTPVDTVRFPEHELQQRRNAGMSRYRLQYMLDTSLADEELHPLKLRDLVVTDLGEEEGPERPIWGNSPELQRQDLACPGMAGDGFYGPIALGGDPGKDTPTFVPYGLKVMALDPSGRGKNETGWNVLGTIGGNLYLLEAGGMLGGYDDATLETLVEIMCRHRVHLCVLEDNFGDGMFEKLLQRKIFERARKEAESGAKDPWRGAGTEAVRHHTQKEARIIDTLEPVMNQHRLIVSSDVVRKDTPRGGEQGGLYPLFFQMSRISRLKGCLVYDDRLDALAIGVRFLTDRMVIDQEKVQERRLEAARDQMWREYWEDTGELDMVPQDTSLTQNAAFRGR